jgi:hypothetical protein
LERQIHAPATAPRSSAAARNSATVVPADDELASAVSATAGALDTVAGGDVVTTAFTVGDAEGLADV